LNTRNIATVALAAVLLLSVAGCALPGSPTGDPLKGTSWRLVTLGGAGLIPGTQITATFEDGQVRGSGGCNSYGGSYQVSGDKLIFSDLYMTEMACLDPEGIMEQEQKYLEFLGMAQTFRLSSGQLQIFASGGEALTFVPAP
jgi:putative lipoprotein